MKSRRDFLAALGAVPFLGALVKVPAVQAQELVRFPELKNIRGKLETIVPWNQDPEYLYQISRVKALGISQVLHLAPLEPHGLARFPKDIDSRAVLHVSDGSPCHISEGEDYLVPTFDFDGSTDWTQAILQCVDAAVMCDRGNEHYNHLVTTTSKGWHCTFPEWVAYLNAAFAKIEYHRFTVANIVASKAVHNMMKHNRGSVYEPRGFVWTARVHEAPTLPDAVAYVLAPPEFVGAIPIRYDRNYVRRQFYQQEPRGSVKRSLAPVTAEEWKVWNDTPRKLQIGVTVSNPRGVAKIEFPANLLV